MELTVREAMKLEGLRECKVLAGHKGLNRVIKYLTVIEVPDILQWLKGNELLLTSFYAFQDDERSICQVVQELDQVKSAALAVKTGRFIDRLPEEVLEYADEAGFPIIEIPRHLKYINITGPIVEYLVEKETYGLRFSEQLHKRFITEVLRSGGGFKRLALLLSQIIYNPVTVYDLEGNVITSVSFGNPELEKPLEALPQQKIANGSQWRREAQVIGDLKVKGLQIPVCVGRDCYGFLVVWELHRTLRKDDERVIEVALAMLALEFAKHKEIKLHLEQYRQDFLDDLLLGVISDEETARHRSLQLGWQQPGEHFAVMLVNLDPVPDGKGDRGSQYEAVKGRLKQAVADLAREYCDQVFVGNKGSKLVILANFQELTDGTYRQRMGSLGRAVQGLVAEQCPGQSIRIGTGRFYSGLCSSRRSFQEARQAVTCAGKITNGEEVVFYDDIGMYQVILATAGRDKLLESSRGILRPLLEYDRQKGSQLVRTLEAYLRCDCNLKETAASLYLHYNTLKYRLKKIEKITGRNLSSEEERFHLHLALKITALCQGEQD